MTGLPCASELTVVVVFVPLTIVIEPATVSSCWVTSYAPRARFVNPGFVGIYGFVPPTVRFSEYTLLNGCCNAPSVNSVVFTLVIFGIIFTFVMSMLLLASDGT